MMEQNALSDPISAEALQAQYAKIVFMLRESRKEVLKLYAVDSEAALLEKIKNGEASEHPAYDHYLSALILDQTRMQLRAEMMEQFCEGPIEPDVCMHLVFKKKLEEHYAQRMTEPVRLAQDAMTLSFDTGLMMELRHFSSAEYSINWSWGEAELRLDTAPMHVSCTTFPLHLHDENGMVRAGPIVDASLDSWGCFSRLLDVLLLDPLLERFEVL